MKKIQLPRIFWLVLLNTALVTWATGCATQEEHSFNHDFGEQLPTAPKYVIGDETDKRFTVTVYQGHPSTGAERVIDSKQAADTVAKAECQRLGWEKWQLNYIQERDQGWMHIVIAEVIRKPYVEPSFPPPAGSM